jgi:CubicO group peptidase (beta-lactamase class C family)
MPVFQAARRVLHEAAAARLFPCAVVEVGDRSRVLWREACGRLTFDIHAPEAGDDTIFDLASLTKVLATSVIAMRLVEGGRLDLRGRVADILPCWKGLDRGGVRVADLLAHSSGLPAHRPFYETCAGREAYEAAIGSERLEYEPGTRSLYSDLGFILLGFVLEDVAGEPLDAQFERVRGLVGPGDPSRFTGDARLDIQYTAPVDAPDRVAPTDAGGRRPGGVHDANAAALDGVAGHAGLFGTANAVGAMARAVLRSIDGSPHGPVLAKQATAARFTSKAGIPGSSRALGWDTMLPTSSCGSRMSERAFGHTGFTGTSLWIDPGSGIYVVQLTNRVYPRGGSADAIARFRRTLHDAVMIDRTSSNQPS